MESKNTVMDGSNHAHTFDLTGSNPPSGQSSQSKDGKADGSDGKKEAKK